MAQRLGPRRSGRASAAHYVRLLTAAAITSDDIREALRRRDGDASAWLADGGDRPAWLLEILRERDWHLIDQWEEGTDGAYGDYADGVAHVGLYAHGDQRCEIAVYPEHSDVDYDELYVCTRSERWTVELDADGEDRGRDSAEFDYESSALAYRSLEACQAEAKRMGGQDLSWTLRADGGRY